MFYCSECQMQVDSMEYHRALYHDPAMQPGNPTPEEIAKVRRYECSMRGHSWTPLMTFGKEDPVALICDNCGRRVKVVPEVESADRQGGAQ